VNASVKQPRFFQIDTATAGSARDELLAGLAAGSAHIAPKYFYDPLGSRLFDAITELPEYYPTRTEAAILARHAPAIAEVVGRGRPLVDLGAGNCEKAARLFGLLQPAPYVAVDISADYLRGVLDCLQRQHPDVDLIGVGVDFSRRLDLPPEAGCGPRTVFYPGSSIGNFTPGEALGFLRQARAAAQGGHLLVGVDLVKSRSILEPAYDDALGVTAAFNLNLLNHVNALAGTDFDVRQWQHLAFFDETASRIEMHLRAREALVVRWAGGERRFAAGERIHTENSVKYRRADFEALLRDAGFTTVRCWTDERDWFAVFAAA
jgi:dimethylhistidine N-methyltransferase